MWIAVTRSCQQFWRRANHVTTTINRAVSTLLGGGDIITVSYSEPLIFFAVTEVVCAGIIMCVFVCGGGGGLFAMKTFSFFFFIILWESQ